MEEYGRYEFNQNQNQYQPVQPEAPKDPKKNHDNLKKICQAGRGHRLERGAVRRNCRRNMVGIQKAAGDSTQVSASKENTSDTGSGKTKLQTTSATSDGSTEGQSLDVSDVASSVMPSIVSITNKSVQEVQNVLQVCSAWAERLRLRRWKAAVPELSSERMTRSFSL